MERTIKFRGLRTDGKGWVYGSLVNNAFVNAVTKEDILYIFNTDECEHADCFQDYDDDYGYYEVIQKTVGQFTGLLDKNGVEIYEGDIDSDGRLIKWNSDMTLFCWSYYNDFRNDYFPSSYPTYANESHKWMIVGNIHEK